MLVLYFQLGERRYAIRCDRVREVAPLVLLNPIPGVPAHFAGIFRYRGGVVPVVDLGRLMAGDPCRTRMSTRIVMVEYDDPEKGGTALVGLLAEKVTEAGKKPDDALLEAGLMTRNSLYFGGILMEGDQMIQFVDLDRLLRDLMRPAAGACFNTAFEVQPG